ncbi:MAG: hypothetical protein AMXMBFR13_40130 [Phycisphaerae bacterium]
MHYDRPALLTLTRRAFNDGIAPFVDAVPFLVTSATVSTLSHTGSVQRLLFIPAAIAALVAFSWLQEWFLWGTGRRGRAGLASPWRAAITGLLPGDSGDLLRPFLYFLLMYFLALVGSISPGVAAALSGVPLLIGGYWTLIGFLRYQDLARRNLLRGLGSARAAALKRAGTTCIVLVGVDVLLLMTIGLAV